MAGALYGVKASAEHPAHRALRAKLARGDTITLSAIGGSITEGHGVGLGCPTYMRRFQSWLQTEYPPSDSTKPHRYVSMAFGAQDSANLFGCFERYWNQRSQDKVRLADVDLWVLETSVNDVRAVYHAICCTRQEQPTTQSFLSRTTVDCL